MVKESRARCSCELFDEEVEGTERLRGREVREEECAQERSVETAIQRLVENCLSADHSTEVAARGGIDDAAVRAAASTGHAAGLDIEARRLVVRRDRATANAGVEMGLIAEDGDHFPDADQGVMRRDPGLRAGETVESPDECGK